MEKVRLGDVVKRVKDFENKDNTSLVYYVGGEHFDNGSLTITRKGLIAGSTIGPAFNTKFREGDVLLMSRNPHLRKAGVATFDGICSDVSYVIRTKNESVIMQEFIPLLFQSDAFWAFAERNKKGSTNFFLNWSDFERFEFFLPDHESQVKICETLWALNKTLDSYKNMIVKNDELIKAQFIEMFSSYPKVNLSELADITMGQSPDSKSYNDDGNGLPFLQGKGDYGEKYAIISHWTTEPSKIVEANTVLMSVRAPVGPVNFTPVKCCIGRGLCGINAKKGKANNEFLYNALAVLESEIASKGVGSTFSAITKNDVYNIKIPKAPQNLFDEFSAFANKIDNAKLKLKEGIVELETMYRRISNKAIKTEE